MIIWWELLELIDRTRNFSDDANIPWYLNFSQKMVLSPRQCSTVASRCVEAIHGNKIKKFPPVQREVVDVNGVVLFGAEQFLSC